MIWLRCQRSLHGEASVQGGRGGDRRGGRTSCVGLAPKRGLECFVKRVECLDIDSRMLPLSLVMESGKVLDDADRARCGVHNEGHYFTTNHGHRSTYVTYLACHLLGVFFSVFLSVRRVY